MIAPLTPSNEQERLKNLYSYKILDTIPETDYDDITRLAAQICNVPISLVSIVDDKRQWFKSRYGLDATETPKEHAFCAHAINDADNVFIINDARKDERFHDNPLVVGQPKVIFYVGVPLKSKNGFPLGTLCVIDNKPNKLSKQQIETLRILSKHVMNLLDLRKNTHLLIENYKNLEEKNIELERFAYVAAHDLKSPLHNISSLAEMFVLDNKDKLDYNGLQLLNLLMDSVEQLSVLVDGLLEYSKSDGILEKRKEDVVLEDLVNNLIKLYSKEHNAIINLNTSLETIYINKVALDQILQNLLTNAIKYNDKKIVQIEIIASETDTHYTFDIKDNGPGIAPEFHDKIFLIFRKLSKSDKYGKSGNGIGLAIVKKLIDKLGGKISVNSNIGKGAIFNFTLRK
ncbi:sensor histidine kinase [Seonamhaeicola marinus]|uniref:histidine kinase n=1 Tax=Seonamhaeicola marinus TaxID=1912246 RepID=A0A5D0HUH7_9FLAO|nr:ATP-binding protein [Seonamhaeicola marinus]TYA74551.1 GAF domain-containing protein [Seonamhaeicola marinus]